MSEAEEIEEAAGRVIDKLESEIGRLNARVAELQKSLGNVIRSNGFLSNEELRTDLKAKTEQCEEWREARDLKAGALLCAELERDDLRVRVNQLKFQRDQAQKHCTMVEGERDQLHENLERLAKTQEYKGNSVHHWWAKAQAYGGIVHGCTPALERAGYPIERTPEGPALPIAQAVESLVKERDHLKADYKILCEGLGYCNESPRHGPGYEVPDPGALLSLLLCEREEFEAKTDPCD